MMTALDLDPEFGAIDLIEELEEMFDFEMTKSEAESCETVGDLYDVICARMPDWDSQAGKCASAMIFYRIRRALDPARRQGIHPGMALADFGQPLELSRKLGKATGLRLPSPHLTPRGMVGGLLVGVGLIAAIAMLLDGLWLPGLAAFGLAAFGLLPLWADRGLWPAGVETIGDLVRRTVPLNARTIRSEGGRPSDRWSILVSLAAEHGSLVPDRIDRATFLHRKSMELANAA